MMNAHRLNLKPVTACVIQESILGPLIFKLYINDLIDVSLDVGIVMCADDTSLFLLVGGCTPFFVVLMHLSRSYVIRLLQNSLKIKRSKTKALLFRPKNINIEQTIVLVLHSRSWQW